MSNLKRIRLYLNMISLSGSFAALSKSPSLSFIVTPINKPDNILDYKNFPCDQTVVMFMRSVNPTETYQTLSDT